MLRFLAFVAVAAAITLLPFGLKGAHADHGVAYCGNRQDHGGAAKACLAVASPFVERYVKPGGDVTWCVDARASAYPGFVSQLAAVMAQYATDLHYTQHQVPMPDSPTDLSCVIRNTMPETHACSACGAWVYTQNLPVLIEYNWRTGYTYWFSTAGHELGHANCLLDEFYDKVAFQSWVLTHLQRDSAGRLLPASWIHGYPTVMDVGTYQLPEYAPLGIWSLTAGDKLRCSETLGRDVTDPPQVDPCTFGPINADGLSWHACEYANGSNGRWFNAAGWSFDPAGFGAGWGVWYDPAGVATWGECIRAQHDCWSLVDHKWQFAGSYAVDPVTHFEYRPPVN